MSLRGALSRFRKRGYYGPAALLGLARTPVGRRQLRRGLAWMAWPLAYPAAWLYRRLALRRTTVIAVVGSYGKTTTTRAVAAALGLEPRTNVNYRSFLAWSLLRVPPWRRLAVLEVGISRPGQMRGYARMLRPDVAVVTSIGGEHRLSLGTLEDTRREKARMVEALPPQGLAVLNGDDEHVRWMASRTAARVVRVGRGPGNDVTAEDVALDWPRGSRFSLVAAGVRLALDTRLLGEPMLWAALGAAAAALELGVRPGLVRERLAALPPTPGRLEPVVLPSGAWLLRDEAKSGLETFGPALELFAAVPARRRLAVIGEITEPGMQGPAYRQLGEQLAAVSDRVVFLGKDRTFKPLRMGLRQGGCDVSRVRRSRTVDQAAELLRGELGPGDVVLLKGRDEQKMERIALLLRGETVRCVLRTCRAIGQGCFGCAMRERGWEGLRPVT
ncbi:MAG TPA: Mur ligase family protein [Thermoanaerobaculia bacterium]|nr:Mur ligase family protein [Thermoanaerobaculia bacterium]